MKREGASTLFIHDFPRALGYLLKTIKTIFHKQFQNSFQTNFQTLKHFSKDKHLCIHSYERESLQRLPKRRPLFKILSKPHKAPFQTIGKAKQVI